MSSGTPSRRRGRPAKSTTFQLVPVRLATPNPRKLSRAFLALAIHHAESQADSEDAEREVRDGTS
jgi:hypothetical protein